MTFPSLSAMVSVPPVNIDVKPASSMRPMETSAKPSAGVYRTLVRRICEAGADPLAT